MIDQAFDMSKIKLLLIIYVCCLNKTTKTINELTNEQPRSHFFLTDPLSSLKNGVAYFFRKFIILESSIHIWFQYELPRLASDFARLPPPTVSINFSFRET